MTDTPIEAVAPGVADRRAERVRTPWSEFWRKFKKQHRRARCRRLRGGPRSARAARALYRAVRCRELFRLRHAQLASVAQALVRRRPAGPRHFQPHPDGRAHLADRWVRVGGGRRADRHALGACGGLLRGGGGTARSCAFATCCSPLPGILARHRHRGHPRQRHGQRDHRRVDLQHPYVCPPCPAATHCR